MSLMIDPEKVNNKRTTDSSETPTNERINLSSLRRGEPILQDTSDTIQGFIPVESDSSQRTRDQIKAELDLTYKEAEMFSLKEREFQESLPEEETKVIREIVNDVFQDESFELGDDEVIERFNAALEARETVPDAVRGYLPTLLKYYSLARDMRRLETEYTPYKVEDVKRAISGFASSVDYVKALQYFNVDNPFGKNGGHYVGNFFHEMYYLRRNQHLASTGRLDSMDFNHLDSIEHGIKQYKERWAQAGFIREDVERVETEESQTVFGKEQQKWRLRLQDKLEHLIGVIGETTKTNYNYRTPPKWSNRVDNPLESLLREMKRDDRINDHMDETESFTDVEWSPAFLQAVETFIDSRIRQLVDRGSFPISQEQYNVWISERVNLDYEKILEELKITGLEQLHGLVGEGRSEGYIKSMIRGYIPAYFLKGIKSINFIHKPKDLDHNDPNTETLGIYHPEYDEETNIVSSSSIDIFIDSFENIREQYKQLDGIDQEALKGIAMQKIAETVFHEIAHNVHHVLTVTELQAWSHIVDNNPVPITWYEKYSAQPKSYELSDGQKFQESPDLTERRYRRESFAEAFALYGREPERLKVLSIERYNYMKTIYENYSTNLPLLRIFIFMLEQGTRQSWDASGWTDEKVRKLYLSHNEN